MSSIFQQKTIKPDDIDTDFLKHLAFATQRGSPIPAASEASAADQHTDQAAVMEGYQPNTVPSAAPDDKLVSEPGMQPADSGEFTLAKIEQSIAEIEAELGWTTDSASPAAVATADDSVKSAALPPGILSTGRPLASTPGTAADALHASSPPCTCISVLSPSTVAACSRLLAHCRGPVAHAFTLPPGEDHHMLKMSVFLARSSAK